MKLLSGIGVLMLVTAIVSTFVMPIGGSSAQWIFALATLVVLPAITYWSSQKNFVSDKRISEVIIYRFSPGHLEIIGESFQSTSTWDKIHKVTKSWNWILIWQNEQIANAIPRRDITEGDLLELKNILNAYNVNNNL